MYFENVKKRKNAEYAFMQKINDNDCLKIKDKSNCLIECIDIMNTELNLTQAIMIILCKLIYDLKLYKQTFKKAYYLDQKEKIFLYVLFSDTSIEKYVNERRVTRSDFKIDAFKIIDAKLIETIKAVSDFVEI